MKLAAWRGEGVKGSVKRSEGMRDLGQDRSFHLCPVLVQIPSPINWGATFWTPPPNNPHLDPRSAKQDKRGGEKTYKIPGRFSRVPSSPREFGKITATPLFNLFGVQPPGLPGKEVHG